MLEDRRLLPSSDSRHHVESSRRSDKHSGRLLVILIKPAVEVKSELNAIDEWNFTDREREVARLMLQGADTKEIQTALGISHNTLKIHIRRVLAKTFTNSRASFVAKLLRSR